MNGIPMGERDIPCICCVIGSMIRHLELLQGSVARVGAEGGSMGDVEYSEGLSRLDTAFTVAGGNLVL